MHIVWTKSRSSTQLFPFVSSRQSQWFLCELASTFCKLGNIYGALKQRELSLLVWLLFIQWEKMGFSVPFRVGVSLLLLIPSMSIIRDGVWATERFYTSYPSADGLALGKRSPTVAPPEPQPFAGSGPGLLRIAINLIDYHRPNPWAFQKTWLQCLKVSQVLNYHPVRL